MAKKATGAKGGKGGGAKGRAKPEPTTTQVKPSEVMPMPSAAKLKSLMSTCRTNAKKMDAVQSDTSTAMREATDKHHLHKRAFADMRWAEKLNDEQIAEYRAHWLFYFEALGLDARADKAQRLPLGDQMTSPADGDGDDDGDSEAEEAAADAMGYPANVVRGGFPAPSNVRDA